MRRLRLAEGRWVMSIHRYIVKNYVQIIVIWSMCRVLTAVAKVFGVKGP